MSFKLLGDQLLQHFRPKATTMGWFKVTSPIVPKSANLGSCETILPPNGRLHPPSSKVFATPFPHGLTSVGRFHSLPVVLGHPRAPTFLRPQAIPWNRHTSRRSICGMTGQEKFEVAKAFTVLAGGVGGAIYGAHDAINDAHNNDCPPAAIPGLALCGALSWGFVGLALGPIIITGIPVWLPPMLHIRYNKRYFAVN